MIGYHRRRRRSVSASPNTFRGRRPESSTATRSNCPDGAYLSGSRFVGVISRRRTETASAADSQPSIASRRFSSVDDRSASAPPVTSRGPRIGHWWCQSHHVTSGNWTQPTLGCVTSAERLRSWPTAPADAAIAHVLALGSRGSRWRR